MGGFISSVMEEPNSHKCVGICLHFIAAFENTALNVLSWQHCLHRIHVILQKLITKIVYMTFYVEYRR